MAHHDYLKKQFDQLGLFLKKVLSKLNGKNPDTLAKEIETIDQQLISKLDYNTEALSQLSIEELKKLFDAEQLSTVAEILYQKSRLYSGKKGEKILLKVLEILEFLTHTQKDISFERHLKIEKIKEVLKKNPT